MTSAQNKREEPSGVKRPSKHAIIMRGVVAPILGLLAVASIVLGYLNATIWKPSSQITAKATVSNTRYLVTDPGVLQLVDSQARLKVDAKNADATVCAALGSAKDVAGWVAGNAYTRISGLNDWTTLATQQAKVQGTPSSGGNEVAFQDSDMWSAAHCGNASVTLDIGQKDANSIALVDLGEDSSQATVSMQWTRQTLPDFATPLYFVGGLLVVMMALSASVFAMPARKRRKRMISSEPVRSSEEVAIGEALTGSLRGLTTAVRIKPKSGGGQRRRHAAHGAGSQEGTKAQDQSAAQSAKQGPAIIDPTSRNMVADQQGAASEASVSAGGEGFADSGEATSVITPDELQEYFARLSQEIAAPDQPQGAAGNDDATSIELDSGDEDVEAVAEQVGDAVEQPGDTPVQPAADDTGDADDADNTHAHESHESGASGKDAEDGEDGENDKEGERS
jgi:hypothetical protein